MKKSPLNRSGIYKITCANNGKIYIGSAANIHKRWELHRGHLNLGVHHNRPLQNAWKKYGKEAFNFEVVEFCEIDKVVAPEQQWLDSTEAYIPAIGFNILSVAYSSLGLKHSPETREKMSQLARKRNHCHLLALNDARRGKPGIKGISGRVWTDEQKQKARERRIGQKTWNKGVSPSDETRRKMAAGQLKAAAHVKFGNERRDEIISLRDSGFTFKEISERCGMSLSQANKIYNGKCARFGGFRMYEKIKGANK